MFRKVGILVLMVIISVWSTLESSVACEAEQGSQPDFILESFGTGGGLVPSPNNLGDMLLTDIKSVFASGEDVCIRGGAICVYTNHRYITSLFRKEEGEYVLKEIRQSPEDGSYNIVSGYWETTSYYDKYSSLLDGQYRIELLLESQTGYAQMPQAYFTVGKICLEWEDVMAAYNDYLNGLAQWADVITVYNQYVACGS